MGAILHRPIFHGMVVDTDGYVDLILGLVPKSHVRTEPINNIVDNQVNYHGIDKKQRREIRAKKQAQEHSLTW